MKYCPKCQTIAQESESPACSDCGTVLLRKDELSQEELDTPVVLTWCASVGEAEVLKTALKALEIDAIVEDESLLSAVSRWDGRGGATDTRVLVRLEDADAALDFLRRKQAGELALADEDVDSAEVQEPPADEARGEPEDK